jgi:protein-disulfide isomerase
VPAGRLPTGFDAWLARCLKRDPAARFADASAARDALLPILDGSDAIDPGGATLPALPPSQQSLAPPPIPSTPTVRGRRIARRVGFAAAVGAAVIATVVWRTRAPTRAALTPLGTSATEKTFDPDDSTALYRVPIGDSPTRGPADAPITIVEFADFECPYSKRAQTAFVAALEQRYAGKLRWVWKDYPFGAHQHSARAAALAREARAEKGNDGFWRAHDLLFAAQPRLEDERLLAIARELGLDEARVQQALAGALDEPHVVADILLADRLHSDGTPTFYINGHLFEDPDSVQRTSKVIDADLARVEKLHSDGTPASAIYDALTVAGRASVPSDRVEAMPSPPQSFLVREGAPGAITVDEVCNFESFFCALMQPTVDRVLARYGNQVRRVWWPWVAPEDRDAARAEAAAEAVRDKFWPMHDAIFASLWLPDFGHPPPDALSAARLKQIALHVGAEMPTYDYGSQQLNGDQLIKMRKLLSQADVTRIPALIIDHRVYGPGTPEWQLDRAVREAIERQKKTAK